jgi:hypothetical protein
MRVAARSMAVRCVLRARSGALGARASLCTLVGIVVSGPLTWLVLGALSPQRAWENAAVFAQNFRPAQSLPYVAGLLLVAGYVGLIASLHAIAPPEHKPAANVALVCTAVYAALIAFNYGSS